MKTISNEYAEQLKRLKFSGKGHKHYDKILPLIKSYNPETILDYGCGNGSLVQKIQEEQPNIITHGWDPAANNLGRRLRINDTYDLLISTDVLEHIEPELADNVMTDIYNSFDKAAWLLICIGPAGKYLADGRNAHICNKPKEWWKDLIERNMPNVNFAEEKYDQRDTPKLRALKLTRAYYTVLLEK